MRVTNQCDAYSHACRCLRSKHSWFTHHVSYGRYNFVWLSWLPIRYRPSLKLLLKLSLREPNKSIGGSPR